MVATEIRNAWGRDSRAAVYADADTDLFPILGEGTPEGTDVTPTHAAAAPALTREERFQADAMPHLDGLFSTASRLLGERSRAEDVVQEVFLHAWKSFDRYEPGTNCRAWLFKILFHCVIHHRRKWFRFPFVRDGGDIIGQIAGPPAPLPDAVTDTEILRALDSIPEDFRAAVLLVDVEEFSYKEAAEILGVPIGTVMSRLSRGRRLLRTQLSHLAQSYGIGKPDRKGMDA